MSKTRYLAIRSVFDRLFALVLLIALSPVFIIVSLLILVGMGAPVIFNQKRVGYEGKLFEIHKFRTMVTNAESLGNGYMPPELNLVPPLGRFLRKTSLDELPQLINILRGQMSFIGPRPALPDQVDRYTTEQRRRLEVLPGISGLAQVRFRNDAPWSVRIQSDLEYIANVSFTSDFRIWMETFKKVFVQQGVIIDQSVLEVDDLGERKSGKNP